MISTRDRSGRTLVALAGGVLAVMLGILCAGSAGASPCTTWEWVNPLPQGNQLLGAVHGNGLWLAVGKYGTVVTTPDGANPVLRASGSTAELRGVVWTGAQFVAVGRSILTSPDGVAWTERVTGTILYGIASGNGLAVAVGNNGAILTSADGVTWTPQVSGTNRTLVGATWGQGQFVVVGHGDDDGATILTSPDGVTWTRQTSPTRNALSSVAWSGTRFIAVGQTSYSEDPHIVSSPDGVAWSGETSSTGFALDSVAWTGTQFVAVGAFNVVTSPDGIAWTTRLATFLGFFAVAAGPAGALTAVGESGRVMTSGDGVTWTDQVFDITYNSFDGIGWNGSAFVAVGGAVVYSPDGFSWSKATVPSTQYGGVAWDGARWVAVGFNGTVLTSPDGVTWTTETSGTSEGLYDVTYGGAQFVAVGYNGVVITSPDGMTWTPQVSGVAEWLLGVASSGTRYVAVGNNGTLLSSPDGVAWSNHSHATLYGFNDVCWAGTQFVAVGGNGMIFTSPDGVSWENRSLSPVHSYGAVAWNGSVIAVGGLSGTVITSPDAITWTAEPSPTNNQLRALVAAGTELWAVGNKSLILHRTTGGLDFGDAPDPTYPTVLASDGARHVGGALYLGAGVDCEADGQPTATADGDDNDGFDDEDGVDLPASLLAGATVTVGVTASGAGFVDAWVDFNGDGDWLDPGEEVLTIEPVSAGLNLVGIAVPLDAAAGPSFARFRLSSVGGLAPTGLAADGEVEDYLVVVEPSAELALGMADSPDPVAEGSPLTYVLRVDNNGTLGATGVVLTVTLPTEVSFSGSTPGEPSCVETGGVVSCDLGAVAAGGASVVSVEVDVPYGVTGAISGSAVVTLNETDPVPGNNSAVEDTTVVSEATHVFSDGFESATTDAWSSTGSGGL
ncbi:MAG TPA: DUF11 domain-containing protein [Methylomirabilota bacterium]|nr:DUF11 domain-containing protein [Methylomirabilota bacterium]